MLSHLLNSAYVVDSSVCRIVRGALKQTKCSTSFRSFCAAKLKDNVNVYHVVFCFVCFCSIQHLDDSML